MLNLHSSLMLLNEHLTHVISGKYNFETRNSGVQDGFFQSYGFYGLNELTFAAIK